MATKVIVSLSDAASDALQNSLNLSELAFDVRYDKLLKRSEATSEGPAVEEIVSSSERRWVSQRLPITLELDGATGVEIAVVLLNAWGVDGVAKHFPMPSRESLEWEIDEETINALLATNPPDPADEAPIFFPRRAKLVPVGGQPPWFTSSTLSVAIVPDSFAPADLGLPTQGAGSALLDAAGVGKLQPFQWTAVKLGIDGSFEARFPQSSAKGWLWWLNSSSQVVGYVPESLQKPHRDQLTLSLPAFPESAFPEGESPEPASDEAMVPADPTETEIAENPQIYSEDPGAFCKPFSNPERVLSERSFHVVVRVTQPEVSPRPSRKIKQQVFVNVDSRVGARASAATPSRTIARTRLDITDVALDLSPVRNLPPPEYLDEVDTMPVGRQRLSAEHPVQWEDDIAQYQASSIALGHIIDYRIRWRSNGYSLGKVSSSLTLAPRQVKRVQKIQFERLERERREESTTFAEDVNDTVDSSREYDNQVAATLSEWSSGSSYSKAKAGAVGAGFALGGFVIGGGGVATSASSGSEASGSRTTTASEMQRLVDSIRRHGDALRKFESTVMTEVSQTEIVTGTSEIVRNFNYGHSLTIIYHQVLRHLKVTTEFGGVRQCLFIPFALTPFNVARALRWRESIEKHLRDARFQPTIGHLREVATNFANSKILPGKRSVQPLTYLRGSLYLTMRIERPQDGQDDAFDAAKWLPISRMSGAPAYSIWAKLARLDRAARDARFQQDDAPPIAAKWIDKLQLQAGSHLLDADFTVASSYGYGRQVRVDFNIRSVAGLNRELIKTLTVSTGPENAVTPGSAVFVDRAVVRYGTARFQRSLNSEPGRDDLIAPETGAPDPQGAAIDFPVDPEWDDVDERQEIRNSVTELVEHLNEHVEHYHKAIWWNMDRDRLLMMLDGFYVPWAQDVSVASVVEREPIAIVGNSLVYTVSPALFLKMNPKDSRAALHNRYATDKPVSDPVHVSLPTDGLYAQSVLDECIALEEHRGSMDWVLDQPDINPESIDSSLLASRRAEPSGATAPTSLPASIINLMNAPVAPTPSGLEGVLGAVTNANAFRDMAGLAGTQANAAAAMQTAASLATNFGNQAASAALKQAEMADKEKARQAANQQLATVKSAQDKGLISAEEANQHANRILEQMHSSTSRVAPHENAAINKAIERVAERGTGGTVQATTSDGAVKVDFASSAQLTQPETEATELSSEGDSAEDTATAGSDEKWIILVAGYNYVDQTRGITTYGTYARNRAALLLVNNPSWKANTKIRFILINVGEGKAYVDDRVKGSLANQSNWRAISGLQFAGTSEDVPLRFRAISSNDYPSGRFLYPIQVDNGLLTPQGWEDQPVFSIVHWYNLLRTFGRAVPGAVLEASILSHGNPFGPILVNSFREAGFHSTSDPLNLSNGNRQRDPADVDGRADADFAEPNMSAADAQEIQKAFASDGFFWLWGCAAFGPFKRLVLGLYGQSGFRADGSTPDSTMFEFKFDTNTEGMQTLRTALANHSFLPSSGFMVQRSLGDFVSFLDVLMGAQYAARVANAFKVKCFATALGTGSAPDGGAKFVVHHVPPIYEKVVAFYENYMRFKRDSEGRRYVDYKR